MGQTFRNKKVIRLSLLSEVKQILRKGKLHTVCEESKCPNIGECFGNHTATFLILGKVCTRGCRYCSVKKGGPYLPPDPDEPKNLAKAAKKLGLKYVVITSVTRDDLPDGGASHFAACIRELKKEIPNVGVEVLTPDFKGSTRALETVLKEEPTVFNCNIETVERLYPKIRLGGSYHWTLKLLKHSKEFNPKILTKSGLIIGLGETWEDIVKTLEDLRKVDCDILTVGQYLQPTKAQMEVVKEYTPSEFEKIKDLALEMGFKHVFVGRWVRSSYRAWEVIS
ncbi:MAG: lipoyl synthase [Aquificae bacterium]|nr:lipoyl synthase [Aquificota bacterium]